MLDDPKTAIRLYGKPGMHTETKTSTTRLELLLFRLNNKQHFGINVLKVKEIISRPALTQIPQSSPDIVGVAELRGQTIPVIDLAMAIGRTAIRKESSDEQKVIIAEFSRSSQGFLVSGVDRIVVRDWKDVLPPPGGVSGSFITGVIRLENELVQLVDVEQVMHGVSNTNLGAETLEQELLDCLGDRKILVVDDSAVARNQTCRILDQLGIQNISARDGKEALELIKELTQQHDQATDCLPIIISDIEMPEMDGYQLTKEIRANPHFEGIYILLHTSLDGQVNAEHAQAAGADQILTKFEADLLTEEIIKGLRHIAS